MLVVTHNAAIVAIRGSDDSSDWAANLAAADESEYVRDLGNGYVADFAWSFYEYTAA